MKQIKERYEFLETFVRKHGELISGGTNSCWVYEGENIKILFREFMRKSSFMIIEDDVDSSFFINYTSRDEILLEKGDFVHLESTYQKLLFQDPIKDLLFSQKLKDFKN